jgi:hypothetical protein
MAPLPIATSVIKAGGSDSNARTVALAVTSEVA